MSDYIKREDAIQSVIAHDALKDVGDSRGYAEWLLNKAPSADVAPVRHGRWIECVSSPHWKCSICGVKAPIWFDELDELYEWLSDFCANCGAKMEGVEA